VKFNTLQLGKEEIIFLDLVQNNRSFQNLTDCSFNKAYYSKKKSQTFIHNFFSNLINRQMNQQTGRKHFILDGDKNTNNHYS